VAAFRPGRTVGPASREHPSLCPGMHTVPWAHRRSAPPRKGSAIRARFDFGRSGGVS